MELVDLYDGKKELTGETVDKKAVPAGKFRLSVHVWIINNQGELLVQQRLSTANKFPNMWSVTGGSVRAGESSLDGVLRELSEELGINATKDEMQFLASYRRKIYFVDVWLLNKNIDIKNIIMQKDEVQAVKWVTLKEFEKMLDNKEVIRSSYDYYKLYIKPMF